MFAPSITKMLLAKQLIGTHGKMAALRAFSSDCEPALRLRNAIADYRERNYTMETPSRFKKELLYPYASNGAIPVDELNKLLVNIGYGDLCLSSQEQLELLRQAGSSGRDIPMKEILELID